MTELVWEEIKSTPVGFASQLVAATPDGELIAHAEYPPHSPGVHFSITGPTRQADTDNSQTWPSIEKYLPRSAWPLQIDGGRKGTRRDPDPVLQAWADRIEAAERAVEAAE